MVRFINAAGGLIAGLLFARWGLPGGPPDHLVSRVPEHPTLLLSEPLGAAVPVAAVALTVVAIAAQGRWAWPVAALGAAGLWLVLPDQSPVLNVALMVPAGLCSGIVVGGALATLADPDRAARLATITGLVTGATAGPIVYQQLLAAGQVTAMVPVAAAGLAVVAGVSQFAVRPTDAGRIALEPVAVVTAGAAIVIVGGQVQSGSLPWVLAVLMVALFIWYSLRDGSVVQTRWVLTAAGLAVPLALLAVDLHQALGRNHLLAVILAVLAGLAAVGLVRLTDRGVPWDVVGLLFCALALVVTQAPLHRTLNSSRLAELVPATLAVVAIGFTLAVTLTRPADPGPTTVDRPLGAAVTVAILILTGQLLTDHDRSVSGVLIEPAAYWVGASLALALAAAAGYRFLADRRPPVRSPSQDPLDRVFPG